MSRYDAALSAYRARDWQQAIELFEDVLKSYPDDGPSRVLMQRCMEFRVEAPAPDWDGVYVMESK